MKNVVKYPVLVTGFVSALFFASCKNADRDREGAISANQIPSETKDDRYFEADRQNKALNASKDSMERAFSGAVEDIERDVQMILEKNKIVSVASNEAGISRKEKLSRDIAAINTAIEDKDKALKKANKEKKQFKQVADKNKKLVAEQESELAALKEEVAQGNYKVEDLNKQMTDLQTANMHLTEEKDALKAENSRMDADLHKAYYVYGSPSELKERKITFKKKKLDASFAKNKDYFTQLDTRETTTIPVYAKKVKVLTAHPVGSYEITTQDKEKVSYINITNPDEFWSGSKYLVVSAKK